MAVTEELQSDVDLWGERGGDTLDLEGLDTRKQTVWDLPSEVSTRNGLLVVADQTVRSRLLAAPTRGCGQ